jgi:hypothetical protein
MKTNTAEQLRERREPFEDARLHARRVEARLSSNEMTDKPHSDLEAFCEAEGREWARRMLEEHLAVRAEQEKRVDVTGADGVERTSVRDSERHLETVLGRVPVPRKAYQAPGSKDLHPMDGALNLPRELFSHGVRRMVAKEASRASFDEVAEMVKDYGGASIAKRQVEELTVRAAQDFDAFYEQRELADEADSTDLLVLSTDAKGVVMRKEDLREATQRKAAATTNKLETRLSGGEKRNRKRMAQVAAVYSVAPWVRTPEDILHGLRPKDIEKKRPKVHGKRVWASVEKSPSTVIRAMFDEALRRDPEKKRRWVVLVDGDAKQLRAVRRTARRVGAKVTILVDIVHVIEYIWKAARALFGSSNPEAEPWVSNRLLELLGGRTGGQVARTIRWWAGQQELDAAGESAIETACGYLADRSRTRLMRYEDALQDGLPIATGVIEGACRHVVKDRMDRTGARWSLTGAEAVLRLRAIRASGDFDEYWDFHLAQEHARNHQVRYADSQVPDPLPRQRRHLKRIK